MRHLPHVIFLVLFSLGSIPTVCAVPPVFGAEQPAHRQVVITIKGMMCASCGREVEKTLKKVAGVVAVAVDLPNDRATVTYDERKVSPRHLAEAIRKAGYEALLPAGR